MSVIMNYYHENFLYVFRFWNNSAKLSLRIRSQSFIARTEIEEASQFHFIINFTRSKVTKLYWSSKGVSDTFIFSNTVL